MIFPPNKLPPPLRRFPLCRRGLFGWPALYNVSMTYRRRGSLAWQLRTSLLTGS